MFDLFREIGQTLSHNRLRTALTGLAVVWGIFMLIVLLGMARGVFNATAARFNDANSSTLRVWGGSTTKAYKGYRDGRAVSLRTGDMDALSPDAVKNLSATEATVSIDTATVSNMRESVSGGLVGASVSFADLQRIDISAGRFINEMDLREKRRVMVMRDEQAKILFGDAEKALGQHVTSMGLGWTVIGIYKNEWRRDAIAPFTTVKSLQGNSQEVDEIQVRLGDIRTIEEAQATEDAVRTTLAARHDFDPDDRNAVYIWNMFESYLQQNSIKAIMWAVVWFIGMLTLLSGIVGVSNIMFVSVRERTHEIGIRRAIGAKPRSVLIQVVAESTAITTLFGYIGIFLGILVTEILDRVFAGSGAVKDCTVDLSIALSVTVVLIVVGALAGIFPAIKATKVSPVEALRDE